VYTGKVCSYVRVCARKKQIQLRLAVYLGDVLMHTCVCEIGLDHLGLGLV